jgi:hypothetical protein
MDVLTCNLEALTPRFATRILVRGPEWPADLRRIVWIECTGVPGALGVTAKMGASLGGWSVASPVAIVIVDGGRMQRLVGWPSGCERKGNI